MPATSSLQSMLPPHRRGGTVGVHARLGRRHPEHAEKRAQRRPRGPARRGRPRPRASSRRRSSCAAERRRPSRPELTSSIAHRERPAGARAAHLDRADQRVAGVELLVTRLEVLVARRRPSRRSGTRTRSSRPASTVDDRLESREKWPCSVRRSSGSSWIKTRAAASPRRRPARRTACTRPRASSTGTARRSR